MPTRIGLLDDHHASEHYHPQQAPHTDPKHNEHQRPAAAQTEHAVAEAQAPGCSSALAIVAHEEAERAPALFEAALLERAELESARDRESYRANDPGMAVKPGRVIHKPVDLGVPEESYKRECRPDEGIASQERSGDRIWASLLPTSMDDHRDHRHTRSEE